MRASQYKAIRDTGVAEFAIYPADVEQRVPEAIKYANRTGSIRACPTGLVRATILKDDVGWSEAFTLGCGDTVYQRKRRNGVLVEVSLEDFRPATKMTSKAISEAHRMRVKRRDSDGTRFVELVVSKLAIMAPWNEYALIVAEREKEQAEASERRERLDAVVDAVGAIKGRFSELFPRWDGEKYVPPRVDQYDYAVRDRTDPKYLRGEVVLSLKRAEEIVSLLNQSRVEAR